MPLGVLFWTLMILWLVFGLWANRADFQAGRWEPFGGSLLLWIILFLVGWRVFGFVVSG